MTAINIKASHEYSAVIGSDLLAAAGEYLRGLTDAQSVMLVSDDTVFGIYGETVVNSLKNAGFNVFRFVFKHGEQSKHMGTVTDILEYSAQCGLTRRDVFAALGGGVTGDITGFAAAIYQRGVDFIQLPTTFLAAIDSSVGGKTGVDLSAGKNLAGAFHQPVGVLCDTDTFKTLPPEVFADGVCEAVKYGMIKDRKLFDTVAQGITDIEDVVTQCVEIKRDIVQADEFDTGQRQLLNFGHTFGHAIEKLSGYGITHGRAVAMGMRLIAKSADKDLVVNLDKVFAKYGIDTHCPYTAREIANAALSDKKRDGGTITLVLIEKIGKAYLKKIPIEKIEEYIL
ncbi:MAG: 3-dehydroquinate synthase [Oscillospiraceae bacterium]|jgi:3-dehydroquinate synthase|nr:3-dehydroquinate synthase [Oscillospiraceae bacterium]